MQLNDNYIVTSKYETITSTKIGGKISQKKQKNKNYQTEQKLQRTAKCEGNISTKMGGLFFFLFFFFLFFAYGEW